MSHFRDTHDDGDLQFSVLEKTYNASHMERLLREAICGLKDLKRGGRMDAMSKLFSHSSCVAKCGRWFG